MSDRALDDYYDRITPYATVEHGGKAIHFSVPTRQTLWRAQTLETKEPETLAWIAGLAADDVLFDVGANVGVYAIWAAATAGARVVAFEPEARNFAVLNENIRLNGLDDRVTAYPVAVGEVGGLGPLYLSELTAGGSNHSFGAEVDHNLKPAKAAFRQGAVSVALDEVIAAGAAPAPTHLKIDVDGLEHEVIAGAARTLADGGVKSVLVEINTGLAEHRDLIDELRGFGFAHDEAEALAARRRGSVLRNTGNCIFRR